MISCLIVDDEPLARDILESYVSEIPELSLMGICKNATEANQMLKAEKVDLLFLDINMPEQSGISFYKTLIHKPEVIFTTAYADYAVEGFDLDATDYLLKPFSFERFKKAVGKVKLASVSQSTFIMLKANKKTHKIDFDEILYLESIGDYVKVFLKDGQVLIVSETLKKLLEKLPEKEFVRVHKSFIVSISKLNFKEGNQIQIGESKIPVGQVYRDDVNRVFGK